jgi:hypothetical protein
VLGVLVIVGVLDQRTFSRELPSHLVLLAYILRGNDMDDFGIAKLGQFLEIVEGVNHGCFKTSLLMSFITI